MTHKSLRVLLFKAKEPDVWVAQALEHCIAAQAATLDGVRQEFERQVAAQIEMAEVNGLDDAFSRIPPSHENYFRAYESGALLAAEYRFSSEVRVGDTPVPAAA